MPASILALVLLTLAAARVTRVITDDKIGEPLRAAVLSRLGTEHMLSYLVHCRWCTGLWLAVPAAAVAWWATPLHQHASMGWWFGFPAVALSMSYVIGLLVRAEPE